MPILQEDFDEIMKRDDDALTKANDLLDMLLNSDQVSLCSEVGVVLENIQTLICNHKEKGE